MKRLALVLLALGLLHLAVLASQRLPPSTAEGLAALALLDAPNQRASGEHDGFALLWGWRRDIPLERLDAALAEDQQRWAAVETLPGGMPEPDPRRGVAAYAELPFEREGLCPRAPESCLDWVRRDPDAARAALQAQQPLLDRLAGLDDADHVRYGFTPTLQSPVPPLDGIVQLTSTRNALLFVAGDPAAALDRSCRDLATWRRLRARTDSLLVDMVGIAVGKQQLHLLAAMLAELPADSVLPAACATALAAPRPDELDQCDDWRGEFRLASHAIEHDLFSEAGERGWLQEAGTRLFSNPRATRERIALGLAAMCRGELDYAAPTPSLLERLYNPAGLVLATISGPAYRDYALRARDFLALLQGLRTADWLREQADPASAFANRPASLQAYAERIHFDTARAALRIDLSAAHPGDADAWWFPIGGRGPARSDP